MFRGRYKVVFARLSPLPGVTGSGYQFAPAYYWRRATAERVAKADNDITRALGYTRDTAWVIDRWRRA